MSNEKQTAVDKLIINFKESITYLESSLDCCNDELTKVQLKARLSQARYFLTYAIEAKEMEKEQMIDFANTYLYCCTDGNVIVLATAQDFYDEIQED
jgi:hypothetical protein